jgi:hypothetical protein
VHLVIFERRTCHNKKEIIGRYKSMRLSLGDDNEKKRRSDWKYTNMCFLHSSRQNTIHSSIDIFSCGFSKAHECKSRQPDWNAQIFLHRYRILKCSAQMMFHKSVRSNKGHFRYNLVRNLSKCEIGAPVLSHK